ncbi:MAG: hypothetical protein AB7O24_16625 [Kofleriaceae bacterium]
MPSLATACYVETTPAPAGPTPAPIASPAPTEPAPAPPPTEPAPPQQSPPVIVANPPRPAPPPPTPPVATTDRRWTIKKVNGECTAWMTPNCPTTKPGEPQLACNPPPPKKIPCPDFGADGSSFQIVRFAGRTDCLIDWGPINCPKNATCNPPPPRKVACP